MTPLRFICALPLLAGLLLGPRAALAQSNGERILNDHYTRSHDYDLVHQRIELGRFDWDSLTFDGRVTTTLVARRAAMDSVLLDAGKLLDVRTVTTVPGRGRMPLRLATARRGDTLVVRLPAPAAFGDTVRFAIGYGGKVENGRGLTFIPAEPGRRHRPQQLWSQGESSDNHLWFPTYDAPNDKLTWELSATVPAPFTVVSNGRLVSDVKRGDQHTMTWSQSRPASSYLVSIVVAPLAHLTDRWRNVPLDYYVYREDSALARPLFRVTPDMIETYTRLTGVAYPWPKYAQTTVADFFGGMENVSATTLVDWLPDPRAYADRPWYQHVLIPHELAHQWFGDLVTTANWANMWLNEGFAEFMPGQYWETKRGAYAGQEYYLDEYTHYLTIDARRRMPLASLGSNNVYPKGALVLQMLKQQLGDAGFWAAMHLYLTRHAGGVAVSDDLRQAVLDATGQNLDWFFDQWVYQAGLPELTVRDRYDAESHRLTFAVEQTQRDSARADSTGLRFTTPEVFRADVEVRIATPEGTVTRRVPLRSRADTIVVDSVPATPTYVVFDARNELLKQLRYDQTTRRLAAQLAADSNLWNRHWLIEQLAGRPDDSLASAALARAARSADYFTTRSQAAAALQHVSPRVALPALRAALADTSADVRAAAAGAVGRLDSLGPDPSAIALAADLARGAWTRDSSYAVRAAALGSLARLDAEGRVALIRSALAMPSYRDAILSAALVAAAQSDDPALVPDVDAKVGDIELASYVLAAVASRDGPASAPALAALEGHLDDDRRWVRRYAVEAMREGMAPARALARLKAAGPTLRHADARADVEKAVAALEQASAGHPATK